ncbi:hypothetical protein D910_07222 [Dendroctonus ponderosae]|uniref:Uncharacterized protein n=1 Tax=Dendroctonus ponderosae TaxID=77166 RepID=U4UC44_DENPD|nr:hypothetical protein D910_07222 [Dendroctonus ponderosae]
MSAALVRQALGLVDRDSDTLGAPSSKRQPLSGVSKSRRKRKQARFTVEEARGASQPPKDVLQTNLRKLELIKKHSRVVLNERATKNVSSAIIERAVSRRPLSTPPVDPRDGATAFTEEDFQKFEAEYMQED